MFSALYCSLREYIRTGVDLSRSSRPSTVGSQTLNCWCQCRFQQSVFSPGEVPGGCVSKRRGGVAECQGLNVKGGVLQKVNRCCPNMRLSMVAPPRLLIIAPMLSTQSRPHRIICPNQVSAVFRTASNELPAVNQPAVP